MDIHIRVRISTWATILNSCLLKYGYTYTCTVIQYVLHTNSRSEPAKASELANDVKRWTTMKGFKCNRRTLCVTRHMFYEKWAPNVCKILISSACDPLILCHVKRLEWAESANSTYSTGNPFKHVPQWRLSPYNKNHVQAPLSNKVYM